MFVKPMRFKIERKDVHVRLRYLIDGNEHITSPHIHHGLT
jgi:hypothetical protein